MNQHVTQLLTEFASRGFSLPLDVALEFADQGYDISMYEDSIDGCEVIDITEVDYFEYIDQNH